MSLEIFETHYFVNERKSYENCDSPYIGVSTIIEKGEILHGPFESERLALAKVEEIKQRLQTEGWSISPKDPENLYHGNYDIYLTITKKSNRLGEIAITK